MNAVQPARNGRVGEDRLDFRAEQQPSAILVIEQRPDAHPVARQQQFLPAAVPDREGELTVEPAEHPRAELLVHVHEHFGVALGVEAVPLLHQAGPQLGIVEDLAVCAYPYRFIRIRHGLGACGEADDCQPFMAEHDLVVPIDA